MYKILDRNITTNNYASFKSCKVVQNGKAIQFTIYDTTYEVPLRYLVQWFSKPHYRVKNGKITTLAETEVFKSKGPTSLIRCRRIRKNYIVRVYFDNLTAVDVVWDTVLMACERKYEHFGGLTNKSKKLIKKGVHLVKKYPAIYGK